MTEVSYKERHGLIGATEVGALLGCHRNTIPTLAEQNKLPAPVCYLGKRYWRKAEIEAVVTAQLGEAPEAAVAATG